MYKILAIIFSLITNISYAQQFKYFNIIPHELEGDFNAGVLFGIASDSQSIYALGLMPNKKPITPKSDFPTLSSINYNGTMNKVSLLLDSTILDFPFWNFPKIRKNDSLYILPFNVKNTVDPNVGSLEFTEVNLRSGNVIKRQKFYDLKGVSGIDLLTQTELKNSVFQFILELFYDNNNIQKNYLYEMDTAMNIRKQILLQYKPPYEFPVFRWVSKGDKGTYDIIVENRVWRGGIPSNSASLSYLKLDSLGRVIKQKQLPVKENIYIATARSYNIIREADRSFVIGCNEWGPDVNVYDAAPYILKTSAEFDTVFWKTRFSEYDTFVPNPRYNFYNLIRMNDGTGYVACADIWTPLYAEADYGILFKASLTGDSLWLRKYQPLAWDSLRASQVTFNQITCTPYNTIAVAAYVGDQVDGWIHPWLLHLDTHGCLIPGCEQTVSTDDIKNKKEKAFLVYPNPTVSDYVYIQSRINAEAVHLDLINLQGQIMKSKQMKMEQGVQYILSLDKHIPIGEYILRLQSGDILQNEKLIIER